MARPAGKKKSVHYVNNKQFLAAMVEFRDSVIAAKEKGADRPQVTPYIGECIMKIAVHLSHKPNFINYTYKDDMISDGIENCLQYIDNFNPAKSSNPFAYFTQIIYYAFLRRIAKEKKQQYTKFKLMDQQIHETPSFSKKGEWNRDILDNFINDFEETKRKKAAKVSKVDEFMKDK